MTRVRDIATTFVIVPRGTWHTVRVHSPATLLFMRPGQDTENREQPRRGG